MDVILDTNCVSALFEGAPELKRLLASSQRHHLPVVVIGEYLYGLKRSRYRHHLSLLLESLTRDSIILRIDEVTASLYADVRDELRALGRPIPENDVWIAALSRQHQLPVISRDQHLDQVPGLERLFW